MSRDDLRHGQVAAAAHLAALGHGVGQPVAEIEENRSRSGTRTSVRLLAASRLVLIGGRRWPV